MKNPIIIPATAASGAEYLSDEQVGKVFRGLIKYFTDGTRIRISDDPMTDMLLDVLIVSARQTPDRTAQTGYQREADACLYDGSNAAPFLADTPADLKTSSCYQTESKVSHLQGTPSYQPRKKDRKSRKENRVEEKESNKEKEEREKEREKEERSRPSSLPLSSPCHDSADALEEQMWEGIKELELTEEEVIRLKELERIRDIREISQEDIDLMGKANITDRPFLVLLLRDYNEKMTEMLPDYVITKKRLKTAAQIFEFVIEENIPIGNLFRKASESSFLCGFKGFRGADFDWIMREDRIKKILDGFYDDYK